MSKAKVTPPPAHTINNEKFARALVRFRTSNDLSLTELAAKTKASRQAIYRAELGATPDVITFLSLCNIIGANPYSFTSIKQKS